LALGCRSFFELAITLCQQVQILQNAAESFELCAGCAIFGLHERQALLCADEAYHQSECEQHNQSANFHRVSSKVGVQETRERGYQTALAETR